MMLLSLSTNIRTSIVSRSCRGICKKRWFAATTTGLTPEERAEQLSKLCQNKQNPFNWKEV